MQYRRREFLHLAAAAVALSAVPRVARAQAWPAKQIRAIIPVTPGSTIDIISRIVFEPLSRQLGHPIIMDNRAGAGTTIGSAVHISTELLRLSAGFDAVHVPFRGMPEALTEVMTGRVDFACSSIAAVLPFIREGKLVALAVSTPQRSSALPEVPTTLELGYKDSDYTFWTGMFLPAKTPRDIVDKLHQETQKALHGLGVPEKLAQQGVDPMPITPAAFDAQIKREIDAILALTKAANLKFN